MSNKLTMRFSEHTEEILEKLRVKFNFANCAKVVRCAILVLDYIEKEVEAGRDVHITAKEAES